MSELSGVPVKIPLQVRSLQVIWILLLSQQLPGLTAAKALNTSLLGECYLSTHHHFHNPLTWSKRHLRRRLLTPEAHLCLIAGIREDNTTQPELPFS